MPVTLPVSNDTIKVIEILQGRSMRQITVDSLTVLETLAGSAIVKQGNTKLSADSIVINQRTGIAEAFGSVHINDADTVHTYANYLRYIGKERVAYLKKNVRLTDHKGVLLTDDLVYDLKTGVATYKGGGRVMNAQTILTSTEGVYYSNTKDVYFRKKVHLVDPKYNITTDSLLYNTTTNIATFIAPTHIISEDGVIDTKSGTYNLNTGEAVFYERTAFRNDSVYAIADKMAYEKKTGILQMEGNAKLVDSANQVIIVGNTIFVDKTNNSFLATKHPVMILYKNGDSTYITADTLYSGVRQYDKVTKNEGIKKDTLNKTTSINIDKNDTEVRYFLAFNHTRIFNDSLQAMCDSLYYATDDSTFKLFRDPIVWSQNSQITGDTIYLYTQSQKPKRMYVFNNGIIINKTAENMYNQIAGRTLNGYFTDGELDMMKVKGSPAESIFYPQDEDSAYTGMNRSSSDVIDIYFKNRELQKVKFINAVDGTIFPLNQIPKEERYLKSFLWLDNKRPKHKLELFE